MIDYVIMPKADYQALCDAIRAKSGKTGAIKSGDLQTEIMTLPSGGSSDDVRYVTFMNGNQFLFRKPVATGDDCVDVEAKDIIPTPTKESDVQYDYTFDGWGPADGSGVDEGILANITEDKTVYANYIATLRSYTVTYLDDDGITVLYSELLLYGATPSYVAWKDGYKLSGWDKEFAPVSGDVSYIAQWEACPVDWRFENGTLTIFGSGPMANYTNANAMPWIEHKTAIKNIVIEPGITHIGSYAFYTTSVANITIPDTVKSIGNRAFFSCTSLSTITIPDSVTSIDTYALCGCSLLTKIVLPNNITHIPAGFLSGCTKLTSITFPANLESIGNGACNATAITRLTLPSKLVRIEYGALQGMSSLTYVYIPASVTYIGAYAFTSCPKLTSAVFANTSGWKMYASETATSGTGVNVTNASTAAKFLRSTYEGYYWKRS